MKDVLLDEASPNLGTLSKSWLIVGRYSLPGWSLPMTSGIWFRGDADRDTMQRMEGVSKLSSGEWLIWQQRIFWDLLVCWDNPQGVNTLSHPQHWTCAGIMLCCKAPIMEIEHRDEGEIFKIGHKGKNLQGGQKWYGWASINDSQYIKVHTNCLNPHLYPVISQSFPNEQLIPLVFFLSLPCIKDASKHMLFSSHGKGCMQKVRFNCFHSMTEGWQYLWCSIGCDDVAQQHNADLPSRYPYHRCQPHGPPPAKEVWQNSMSPWSWRNSLTEDWRSTLSSTYLKGFKTE